MLVFWLLCWWNRLLVLWLMFDGLMFISFRWFSDMGGEWLLVLIVLIVLFLVNCIVVLGGSVIGLLLFSMGWLESVWIVLLGLSWNVLVWV